MIRKIFILFILTLGFPELKAQLYINEILSSNTQTNYDPDFTGFSDWVEIYNSNATDINLLGYYLSDDTSFATKWQFPNITIQANSYLLIWADGLAQNIHTNFKLSRGGETVSLYTPDSVLIDRITYPPQEADISYGRDINNIQNFVYFYKPTPDAANNTNSANSLNYTNDVVFSQNGGFYSSQQSISLSTSSATAKIRYTTNGEIPTENSNLYTNPILLDTTTIIRARCFDTNLLPSKVITNTYFFNINHTLPVISLTTEPNNLWNDTIGIYCVGTNGETNYGVTANYWNDWERPANIELFETNKQQVINQKSGIAINGERRNMAQKSLRVFARNKYGDPSFDYKIFSNKDINSFSSLILRNGGLPDFKNSMIRDGLSQGLINEVTDIDHQGSRQAVLYLNGQYWGIYNIKEKQNEDYLVSNNAVNPNNISVLESYNYAIVSGYKEDYEFLLNYLQNNNLNNDESYEFLNRVIDIDEYIDYMSTEIYLGNYDWPMINIKFWKENNEQGKWRWLLYDMDPCMGLWGDPDYNSMHHAIETDTPSWPNPPNSTLFFRSILKSDKFKNEFIQRFAARANTTFDAERIKYFADSMASNIATEMINHIARWKDFDSPDGTCVQTIQEWEASIANIKWFADERELYIKQHVINEFNLTGLYNLTSQSANGYIKINDVKLTEGSNLGSYFANIPIRFKAVPKPGYTFIRWEGASNETTAEITLNLQTHSSITAVFEPTNYTILPDTISNNYTLTLSESPYLGLTDLVVDSFASLSIEAGVQIYMSENTGIYVYGQLITNGTEINPIKIENYAEAGFDTWNALCFYNATDTSYLNYTRLRNTTTGHQQELQNSALSSYNSNLIIYNLDIDDCTRPFYSELGSTQISSSKIRCDEICDLIHIKNSNNAIVENCDLKGNESVDTDGIDFDGVNNGIIRNNKIYSLIGFNSDGIDAGEGCNNLLIENNTIYNCNDKGISVGQKSNVIIKNNIIYNCSSGIGIKDSLSYAEVINNTFYGNDFAISCFEKNYGAGGGSADVTNCIFASSNISSFYVDNKPYSNINISYSLSNTNILPGNNNFLDNPLFNDTLRFNFTLSDLSPCIDAGDPTTPPDSDGSIADIGAYSVWKESSFDSSIVINEINYFSYLLDNSGDWFELYNNGENDIDLSAWCFMDEDNSHKYYFPEGFVLEAHQYIVFCNNFVDFNSIFPNRTNFRGNFNFSLKDTGEKIRLYDSNMNLIDFVEYSAYAPWPIEAYGSGPTLELIDASFDNSLAESWQTSQGLGSPGLPNNYDYVDKLKDNLSFALFPNPATDYIHITIENKHINNSNIFIYDIFGKIVLQKTLYPYQNKIRLNVSELEQGIYFIKINEKSKKLIKK